MNKLFNLRNLKFYIVIIIILPLFWIQLFSVLNSQNKQNDLTIFISSSSVDVTVLTNFIVSNTTIKNVNFTNVDPNDTLFSNLLLTVGILDSDLLILPANIIESVDLSDNFNIINFNDLENRGLINSNINLLKQNDDIYGFNVKTNQATYFSACINFITSENYYLVLNKNSFQLKNGNIDLLLDIISLLYSV